MSNLQSVRYNPVQSAGTFIETSPLNHVKTVTKYFRPEAQRQCITAFDLQYILENIFDLSPVNANDPENNFSLPLITQTLQQLQQSLTQNVDDLQQQIDDLPLKGVGSNTSVLSIIQPEPEVTIFEDETRKASAASSTLNRSKSKHRGTLQFSAKRNHTYLISNKEDEQSVLSIPKEDIDQFITGDTLYFRNSSITLDSQGAIVLPLQTTNKDIIIVMKAPYRFLSATNTLSDAVRLSPGAVYYGIFNKRPIVNVNNDVIQVQDAPSAAVELEGVFEQILNFPTQYENVVLPPLPPVPIVP